MGKKNKIKKKVQVVICHKALTNKFFLIMQMCEQRNAYWQNVTGSVNKEEKFLAAAYRELLEETGFDKSSIKELINLNMDFQFEARDKQFKEKVYLAFLNDKKNPTLSSEHQAFKWINADEIQSSVVYFESNYTALVKANKYIC